MAKQGLVQCTVVLAAINDDTRQWDGKDIPRLRTRGDVLHTRLARALAALLSSQVMSSSSQTLESSSHFKSILDAALSEYKSKTGNDLTNNSLARELQGCENTEAVLGIIQREAKAIDKFKDKGLMKWIGPSVDILYTISGTLGQGVGMVRIIKRFAITGASTNVACRCFPLRMWFLLGSES